MRARAHQIDLKAARPSIAQRAAAMMGMKPPASAAYQQTPSTPGSAVVPVDADVEHQRKPPPKPVLLGEKLLMPIHPRHRGRVMWDLAVIALLMYIIVVAPFVFGFSIEAEGGFKLFEQAVDAFFIIDVFVNCLTGMVDERGVVNMNLRVSLRAYLRGWFTLDFVSSVPWDWFPENHKNSGGGATQNLRVLKMGKLFKVFKVLRISKIFREGSPIADKLEEVMVSSDMQNMVKLAKMGFGVLIVCHILACGWIYVGRLHEPKFLSGSTWMNNYVDGDDFRDDGFEGAFEPRPIYRKTMQQQYIVALYWSLMTLTSVGYGDVCPESDAGRVYAIFTMLAGSAIYGYIIGSITTVCSSVDAQRKAYYDRMDLIQAYMQHHDFPAPLRFKVRSYFKRYFTMRSALDERAILNDLDPDLQHEVGTFLLQDVVRSNPIFAKLSSAVLTRLVVVLKPMVAEPGQKVMTTGQVGEDMFIVLSGELELTNEPLGLNERLGPGASEGELFAFGIAPMSEGYEHDVTATAVSELYVLSQSDINAAFESTPEVLNTIRKSAIAAVAKRDRERRGGAKAGGPATPGGGEGGDADVADKPNAAGAAADMGRGRRKRSSLVGGGGATLPNGFADMTLDSLDETYDLVAELDKRTEKTEDMIKKLMESQREIRLGMGELLRERGLRSMQELVDEDMAKHKAAARKRLGNSLHKVSGGASLARFSTSKQPTHTLALRFAAVGLEAADISGTSDPYLIVLQETEGEPKESCLHRRVAQTRPCPNTLDPVFEEVRTDTLALCQNDDKRRLVLQCWDCDAGSEDDLIGACVTTLAEMRDTRGHAGKPFEIQLTISGSAVSKRRRASDTKTGKLQVLAIEATPFTPAKTSSLGGMFAAPKAGSDLRGLPEGQEKAEADGT